MFFVLLLFVIPLVPERPLEPLETVSPARRRAPSHKSCSLRWKYDVSRAPPFRVSSRMCPSARTVLPSVILVFFRSGSHRPTPPFPFRLVIEAGRPVFSESPVSPFPISAVDLFLRNGPARPDPQS